MAYVGFPGSGFHHDRRAVGGAGAGGRVTWLPLTHAAGSPAVSGTANDILEQHKGPVDGEQPGPLALGE